MKALCCCREPRGLGMKGKCSWGSSVLPALCAPAVPRAILLCWASPALLWHRQDLPRASAATTKSQKSRRFRTCLKPNKLKAGTATGTFTFQTHFSKYEIPNTFRALGFVTWKGGIWFQWQLKKTWLWKVQYTLQLIEKYFAQYWTAKIKEWTGGSSI